MKIVRKFVRTVPTDKENCIAEYVIDSMGGVYFRGDSPDSYWLESTMTGKQFLHKVAEYQDWIEVIP